MTSVISQDSSIYVCRKRSLVSTSRLQQLTDCVDVCVLTHECVHQNCQYVCLGFCAVCGHLRVPLHLWHLDLLLRCHLGALNTPKLLIRDAFVQQVHNLATAEQTQLDCGRLNAEICNPLPNRQSIPPAAFGQLYRVLPLTSCLCYWLFMHISYGMCQRLNKICCAFLKYNFQDLKGFLKCQVDYLFISMKCICS